MDCRDRIVLLSQHGVKLRNVFHSVNVFSPEEKGQSELGVYVLCEVWIRVNRFYTWSNICVCRHFKGAVCRIWGHLTGMVADCNHLSTTVLHSVAHFTAVSQVCRRTTVAFR